MVKRWQRTTFNVLSALVAATGILYFWMNDLLVSDDPLAVVNHPLQPVMLDLHILAAPLLLVIFGTVFQTHVTAKLSARTPLSRSGLTSLITFAVMAWSGYVLQVVVNERLHLMCRWLHIGSGLVFAVSYSVHFVTGFRAWGRSFAAGDSSAR